jgi:hypothetical protein
MKVTTLKVKKNGKVIDTGIAITLYWSESIKRWVTVPTERG